MRGHAYFLSRLKKVNLRAWMTKMTPMSRSVNAKIMVDTVMAPVHSDTASDVASLGLEFHETIAHDQ
jgi:hypothetical protein